MLSFLQSIIGTIGAFSFIVSISFFRKRKERKRLIVLGLGSLVLVVLGFL